MTHSKSSLLPKISLHPALPTDYPAIAHIECAAFWDDPFSQVAFGPLRGTDEALRLRVKSFEKEPKDGERLRWVKAVLSTDEGKDGGGEIVGFAMWTFNEGGDGKGRRGREEEENKNEEDGSEWGLSANVKFCEDVFLPADEDMLKATKGRPYAKLFNLSISPQYQRRGIGSLLLGEGLRAVDEEGLQAVLGASPEGVGLYRKFGFVETRTTEWKLWEYEGGEGMGRTKHVVMWRPSREEKEPLS